MWRAIIIPQEALIKRKTRVNVQKFQTFLGVGGGNWSLKNTGLFLHSLLKCEVITKETEVFASGTEELRWGLLWASKDELRM